MPSKKKKIFFLFEISSFVKQTPSTSWSIPCCRSVRNRTIWFRRAADTACRPFSRASAPPSCAASRLCRRIYCSCSILTTRSRGSPSGALWTQQKEIFDHQTRLERNRKFRRQLSQKKFLLKLKNTSFKDLLNFFGFLYFLRWWSFDWTR